MSETQGNRVEKVMMHFKLGQDELAETLKVSQAAVSKMLRAQTISMKMVKKITESYKVDSSWLLSGEGEMFGAQKLRPSEIAFTAKEALEMADRMADKVREDYKERITELNAHITMLTGLLKKNKIIA